MPKTRNVWDTQISRVGKHCKKTPHTNLITLDIRLKMNWLLRKDVTLGTFRETIDEIIGRPDEIITIYHKQDELDDDDETFETLGFELGSHSPYVIEIDWKHKSLEEIVKMFSVNRDEQLEQESNMCELGKSLYRKSLKLTTALKKCQLQLITITKTLFSIYGKIGLEEVKEIALKDFNELQNFRKEKKNTDKDMKKSLKKALYSAKAWRQQAQALLQQKEDLVAVNGVLKQKVQERANELSAISTKKAKEIRQGNVGKERKNEKMQKQISKLQKQLETEKVKRKKYELQNAAMDKKLAQMTEEMEGKDAETFKNKLEAERRDRFKDFAKIKSLKKESSRLRKTVERLERELSERKALDDVANMLKESEDREKTLMLQKKITDNEISILRRQLKTLSAEITPKSKSKHTAKCSPVSSDTDSDEGKPRVLNFLERQKSNDLKSPSKNSDLNERLSCLYCMSAERSRAVVPCSHLVYCNNCWREHGFQMRDCPVCRGDIDSVIEVLIP